MGETEGRSKFWDKFILYKKRAKAELCWTMYALLKNGRLAMELGVVVTHQNFGFLFFFVFCWLCQGKGGQRSTRARGGAKRG